MDSITIERRRVRPVREADWKRMLSPDQSDTLRTLEQVGWSLRFVRRGDDGAPAAAVYNPDTRRLSIIDPAGRLVENPGIAFRAD
jgi:hypothetical protein